jgi:hypothetical protein
MTTFDLETETLPVWPNGRETVEAADALAESAADLLGEAVAGDTAEYASETSAPGSAESEGQDIPASGAATEAEGMPLPVGEEAAAPCSEVPTTQPSEPEAGDAAAAALKARRKVGGARGHYTGEGVGAYVGHSVGGRRIKPHSNHHELGGVHFQIRTINGSQGTFTGAKTDPEKIIVAAKKRDGGCQGDSRYMLYGVRRADALMVAKKSRSRGHVNSGHQLISLSQVQKVELGSLIIPDDLVVADTSEQRTQRLDRIGKLEPDLDNPTVKATRAFLAEQVNPTQPTAHSATDLPNVRAAEVVPRGDSDSPQEAI